MSNNSHPHKRNIIISLNKDSTSSSLCLSSGLKMAAEITIHHTLPSTHSTLPSTHPRWKKERGTQIFSPICLSSFFRGKIISIKSHKNNLSISYWIEHNLLLHLKLAWHSCNSFPRSGILLPARNWALWVFDKEKG